eukprot:1618697-Pleurochrysis_carterae.AAC.3
MNEEHRWAHERRLLLVDRQPSLSATKRKEMEQQGKRGSQAARPGREEVLSLKRRKVGRLCNILEYNVPLGGDIPPYHENYFAKRENM